ncbi:P-loop containing nucleoside triphosphate hydrolase protein [Xylaria grammica]|nr:P-loop containing nucleoside triphosphate hydrolase protein [Xylaria grammica]
MDDTNSIASFEEIAPNDHTQDASQPRPSSQNALTELSLDTSSSVDLADDDVPDVCYVLQFKEFGKGLVEIRRGSKPIDPEVGETLGDKSQKDKKKPVIEIVTVVSTSLVANQPENHHHYGGRYHPPGYPGWPFGPPRPNNNEDESDMRVTKSQNTCMVIRSRHLINALAAVIDYYPGTTFMGDEVKIEAPYYVLVHNRAALLRYKDSQPATHDEEYKDTTSKHIDILIGFLEQTYGQQIREEGLRHCRKIPTATYEWIWLLLRPGQVIYTQYDNTWSPFAISRVFKKVTNNADGICSYSIDCWNYMYTDGKLRRKMHTFDINPFSGEEAIHNLPVIPAEFFTGSGKDVSPSDANAEQIRLGKLVWELYKRPSYKLYDGDLAKKSATASSTANWDYSTCPTGYMSGRVIVDGEGYERYNQLCPLKSRRRYPYDDNPPPPHHQTVYDQLPYFASRCSCHACGKGERSDDLSPYAVFQDLNPQHDKAPENDLYYHVVSKVVAGFLLGERRWGHFHVEMLRDIKFDREAFKYLVLDDEIKTTVKALIGKFASDEGHVSAWPNDFVKNKGQGRIFLLHGSPGVGKTCTAECVAELTHRPLLSLTSGDLSTDSLMVEQNLEYFLALGERFGAIVLLDEADVYLESRRNKDIERNGLVSVFLRALEYYRGVLFLTTNRVQTFDAAFTSRIHVALHYGPLTDTDRERIWLNGFDRLERDAGGRVHVAVAAREYAWRSAEVRLLRWNGREIRNALQTAVALAESEALEDDADVVLVTDKHLRSVVRMSRGFKNFMQRRREDDDDDDDDEDDRGHGHGHRHHEIEIYDDDDDDDNGLPLRGDEDSDGEARRRMRY